MKFRVMQHNDHDWRDVEACKESGCQDFITIEAQSAEEAVVRHYEQHTPHMVTTLHVQPEQECVYKLDLGEADDSRFAFIVQRVHDDLLRDLP